MLQVRDDLNTLISVLENPVFQSILNIQNSLRELKKQVNLHPSILPEDFDITSTGELVLNLPPTDDDSPYQNGYEKNGSQEDGGEGKQEDTDGEDCGGSGGASHLTSGTASTMTMVVDKEHAAPGLLYDEEFKKTIDDIAQGREISVIQLFKPDGKRLGFSVVGLRSEHKGELGIYVKEIQQDGIAGGDGQVREGDQILAIDGQVLDSNISHQQAIAILQKTQGSVDLVVARGKEGTTDSLAPRDMPEIETMEVELVKDNQGLGITFAGYTCEREELSGIFVRSVTEGSAADRSGMVNVNDQIVEVDGLSLQGYSNQQAVEMLRSTGSIVNLKLVRYVHGLKFEQLQQAIASSSARYKQQHLGGCTKGMIVWDQSFS